MKVAFKMKLKHGFSEEYKKRHDQLWPELSALLTENGVSNYSIFLDEETNVLFAVQENKGEGSQDLGSAEIVQQWWAYMADIMETNPDHSPQSTPLKWYFTWTNIDIKKMKRILLALTLFLCAHIAVGQVKTAKDSPWPVLQKEMRPWTRWRWMGNAVDQKNLKTALSTYQQAGIGGVEITPIYGAKGYEDRYIDFLSPKWMDMLHFTAAQTIPCTGKKHHKS